MRYQWLILVFFLTGCTPSQCNRPDDAGLDKSPVSGKELTKREKLNVDTRLLTLCPPLADVKTNPSAVDVLAAHKSDLDSFIECRSKFSELIDIVKKVMAQ